MIPILSSFVHFFPNCLTGAILFSLWPYYYTSLSLLFILTHHSYIFRFTYFLPTSHSVYTQGFLVDGFSFTICAPVGEKPEFLNGACRCLILLAILFIQGQDLTFFH